MVDLLAAALFLISIPYWAVFLAGLTPLKEIHPKLKKYPSVSVVVPARNEEKTIEKTLRSVRKSRYPGRMEIIVVDANSSDRTAKIVRKYADRIIIEKNPRGKPAALNRAIKSARHEVIYILDADSTIGKNTIRDVTGSMHGYAGSSGINLPGMPTTLTTLVGRIENMFMLSTNIFCSKVMDTCLATGKNFAVRKDVLRKLGGFRDALTEDINLSIRLYEAGYKLRMVPVYAEESIPPRFSWYMKQQKRWHAGSVSELLLSARTLGSRRLTIFPIFVIIVSSPVVFFLFVLLSFIFSTTLPLILIMPILLLTVSTAARYLSAKDAALAPATFFVFGFIQFVLSVWSSWRILSGRNISWQKTPK